MTDSNEPYARNPGHTTDLTEPEAHQSLRETRGGSALHHEFESMGVA